VEYTGTNENAIATYTNCVSGAVLQVILYPSVFYQFCSCTVPTGTDLSITDLGPCVEVTPSPTRTPTPSPTPGCECSEYLLENESASSSFFQYIDCTGEAISDSLGAFQVADICACDGTVEGDDAINIAYLGPCPTPLPTPSPTRTPTPTRTPPPTPGCFLTWNITECGGACSGGLCACENQVSRTVYTDCTVTSLTNPFTEIYENTALTNPYTADFLSSGSIYNSSGSGVSLVCNVGGPC
jgi:hypothetical protein